MLAACLPECMPLRQVLWLTGWPSGYWYYCKIRAGPPKEGTNGEFALPPGNLLIGRAHQFLLRFAPSENFSLRAESGQMTALA